MDTEASRRVPTTLGSKVDPISVWVPLPDAARQVGVAEHALCSWCDQGLVAVRHSDTPEGAVALVDIREAVAQASVPTAAPERLLVEQPPEWARGLADAWNRAERAERDLELFKQRLGEVVAQLQSQEEAARAAHDAAEEAAQRADDSAREATEAAATTEAHAADGAVAKQAQEDVARAAANSARAAEEAASRATHEASAREAQLAASKAAEDAAEASRKVAAAAQEALANATKENVRHLDEQEAARVALEESTNRARETTEAANAVLRRVEEFALQVASHREHARREQEELLKAALDAAKAAEGEARAAQASSVAAQKDAALVAAGRAGDGSDGHRPAESEPYDQLLVEDDSQDELWEAFDAAEEERPDTDGHRRLWPFGHREEQERADDR